MRILTHTGTVPVGAALPRFADLFPSLVEPKKIVVSDGFTLPRATLNNGAFDYPAGSPKRWRALANFNAVQGVDGGYVVRSAAGTADQTVDLGTPNHKSYVAVRWKGAGSAGAVARWSTAGNLWRLQISSVLATVNLTKTVGGIVTTLWSAPIVLVEDQVYLLGLECEGNQIRAALDNKKLCEVTDPALNANTMAGFSASTVTPRILEFAGGTV